MDKQRVKAIGDWFEAISLPCAYLGIIVATAASVMLFFFGTKSLTDPMLWIGVSLAIIGVLLKATSILIHALIEPKP